MAVNGAAGENGAPPAEGAGRYDMLLTFLADRYQSFGGM